jgi:oligosaccharide repeat unit polymerase
MNFLFFTKNKLLNVIIIHWAIIIFSVGILVLGFSFDIIHKPYLEFLKWQVILVFLWAYFSFGYIGMPFYHPYRMFLIAFFSFLLGRIFLDILGFIQFEEDVFFQVGLRFSLNTQFLILCFLMLFLLFFHLSALILYKDVNKVVTLNWTYNERFYRIGLILFWVWLAPAIFYWYQYVSYVLVHGYRNLTADDKIITPNFIIKLADDFFTIGYFFLLASKPNIKKLRWPTVIYILVMLCTLLTGRRIFFFTQMLMIVTYFGFRDKLSKKVIVILGVFMMMLAVIVGIFRSLSEFSFSKSVNYNNIMIDFFATQGISVHAIGLTIDYNNKELISKDIRYFFEPVNNIFVQFGNAFGVQTRRSIQDDFFLGDRISYIYEVNMLSRGGGLGSSLIAEFYIVGGVFGVVIGGFLYGLIIMLLVNKWFKSNLGVLLLLFVLPMLYFTPRAHPLQPFTEAVKPCILIAIITLIDKLLVIKPKLENGNN